LNKGKLIAASLGSSDAGLITRRTWEAIQSDARWCYPVRKKDEATKEVWYYEHKLPEGYKAYSKTKPIQMAEFDGLKPWWGDGECGIRDYELREENERAWRVNIETIAASGYNLDIKNPHQPEEERQYTSAELLGLLQQSFEKSDDLLIQLRKELIS